MKYTYEDVMHHINLFYSYNIKKINEDILSYFKKILKSDGELYDYKYHVKILIEENGIEYIAKTFLTIESLIYYFDNLLSKI